MRPAPIPIEDPEWRQTPPPVSATPGTFRLRRGSRFTWRKECLAVMERYVSCSCEMLPRQVSYPANNLRSRFYLCRYYRLLGLLCCWNKRTHKAGISICRPILLIQFYLVIRSITVFRVNIFKCVFFYCFKKTLWSLYFHQCWTVKEGTETHFSATGGWSQWTDLQRFKNIFNRTWSIPDFSTFWQLHFPHLTWCKHMLITHCCI